MSIVQDAIKKIEETKNKREAGVQSCDISIDDIESFGDMSSIKEMYVDIKKYNDMLSKSITFVNPTLTNYIPFTMENLYLICAYTGSGKCFAKGTKILMYDGSVKNVEDIVVGDVVMGPDSKLRNVLSLGRGREQMYDVISEKGDKYTVNESHILSLIMTTTNDIVNISIKDYLNQSTSFKKSLKGYRTGVDFKHTNVPVDPYYIGYQLGDKNSLESSFSTIPDKYLINSRNIRLQLLAGLIDSNIDFCFKNKLLANSVIKLCRSLGFAAYIELIEKAYTTDIGYKVTISGDLSTIPTIIQRKPINKIKQIKNVLHTEIKVIPSTIQNYYGFAVDSDHLFLLEDFTVVHNSTLAANVSFPLWKQGQKTLILSNEESKQDVLFRIGCLELGYNFNSYKKGVMSKVQQLEVMKLFPEISKYVKVLDVNFKDGFTMRIEAVQNALEKVKQSDYSCVMIDYFQLIQYSVSRPDKKRFDVLTDLWIWMRKYIKQSNIPIVLFAQLHSIGKRGQDLDSRIKECPGVMEAASVIIEVIPNFETHTSDFLIQKDRFGFQGKKITCMFKDGMYIDGTPDQIMDHVNKCRVAEITGDDDFNIKQIVDKKKEDDIHLTKDVSSDSV